MMVKGDIVLITFPFTDLSGSKLRPAVILANTIRDITTCFITSQIDWREPMDVLVSRTLANGLRKQSLIRTNKIATLDMSLARGLLGKLSQADLISLDTQLKFCLSYLDKIQAAGLHSKP